MSEPVREYRPDKWRGFWVCWVIKSGWYRCSTNHRTRAAAVKHCAELNGKAKP